MNAIRRKTMVKFCLAMGLFILAGVFRQLDQDIPPLAAAACFMLTNLIYIGLAMAWGFSISNRILHKNVRQYLLLGCAMAVMWMFLRTVKYRFFEDNHVTRYLWYLYYVPQSSRRFSACLRRWRSDGGRATRFLQSGICCSSRPRC